MSRRLSPGPAPALRQRGGRGARRQASAQPGVSGWGSGCSVSGELVHDTPDMAGWHRRRRSSPLLLAAGGLWAGLAAEAAAQGRAGTDRAALEALWRLGLDRQRQLEDVGGARRVVWGVDRRRRPGHAAGAARQRVDGVHPRSEALDLGVRWGPRTGHERADGTFTELRTRIDALRRDVGLEAFPWTDGVLTAGVTPVRLVHLLELRESAGRGVCGIDDPRSGRCTSDAACEARQMSTSRRFRRVSGD